MNQTLDPIRLATDLAEAYRRYLLSYFPLRHPRLRAGFNAALEQPEWLVKGPLLEANAPFETDKSIRDLVYDNVLHEGFARLCRDNPDLRWERPLYRHQEAAARSACAEDKNLVVATGTGSGKTESFLIPILDHLLREQAAGTLGPGVRALVLYPMNALANDQLKRLRGILAHYPAITFGRYTGETKETEEEARSEFRAVHHTDPLKNEILSREAQRKAPPHLLLTNYSMLEYLLLRPDDSVFFDGAKARHWRFFVLDEAHQYGGALGIEMAILLRRLKDRVAKSETGRIRCIATSATLGGTDAEVEAFAANLMGEPQGTWAVIKGEREEAKSAAPWTPEPEFYPLLLHALAVENWEETAARLGAALMAAGAPSTVVDPALGRLAAAVPGSVATVDEWGEVRQTHEPDDDIRHQAITCFLFDVLSGDQRVLDLRCSLKDGPRWLVELATGLAFPGLPKDTAVAALQALVSLAAMAREEPHLPAVLPARYHLFARSLEGLFVAPVVLSQAGERFQKDLLVTLDRREQLTVDDEAFPVYELATCGRCGQSFYVGDLEDRAVGRPVPRLVASKRREDGVATDPRILFTCDPELDDDGESMEDEEDEADGEDSRKAAAPAGSLGNASFCTRCGGFQDERMGPLACGCDPSYQVPARYAEPDTEGDRLPGCPSCKARRPLERFLTTQDAPVSVLASRIYQHLPGDSSSQSPGDGRKLLVFADSRQAAAYFAPFMEQSYEAVLRRRLWLDVLSRMADGGHSAPRPEALESYFLLAMREMGWFKSGTDPQQESEEAWRLILEELLDDVHNSLVGQAIVSCRFDPPRKGEGASIEELLRKPDTPLARLIPDPQERSDVFQLLANSVRRQLAVSYHHRYQAGIRERPATYLVERSADSKRQRSWLPKQASNSRMALLRKCLGLEEADAEKVLGLYWKLLTEKADLDHSDLGYQLPIERSWTVQRPDRVFECEVCGRRSALQLRGICPQHRCSGRMVEVPALDNENYYAWLARRHSLIVLRAREHTAQLTSEEAAKVQERFIKGDVNLLSCSTTFELGVDVGDLQAVVMRNMPPGTANYLQRVGRAGRRTDSVAIALTFAQRRSHDLYYYLKPREMVAGNISVPRVTLGNRKIIWRHIGAVVLGAFFKTHSDLFGKVGTFYDDSAFERLGSWLAARPTEVLEQLRRIVPTDIQTTLGIDETWRWVREFLGEPGVALADLPPEGLSNLMKSRAEVSELISEFERLEKQAKNAEDYKFADRMQKERRKLQDMSLISFMSSRGVIPKYGFPVDLVELKILQEHKLASKLELTRDLKIAIAEYAPGSEVVAAGYVWRSAGLMKWPQGRPWTERSFSACKCGWYQSQLTAITDSDCPKCGQRLLLRGQFVVPQLGFVTRRKERAKRVTRRPERTWASQVFFAGYGESQPPDQRRLEGGDLSVLYRGPAEGKLVVVNTGHGHRGFQICSDCGAARPPRGGKAAHESPWGFRCEGTWSANTFLGHEFLTDVVELRFTGHEPNSPAENRKFWWSLLYAVLEGMCRSLDIKRDDVDGVLYQGADGTSLMLYDTVPGGAGHVKRLIDDPHALESALRTAWAFVEDCSCAPESSCYACLRNYRNQQRHDDLRRDIAVDYLGRLVSTLFASEPTLSLANSRGWLTVGIRQGSRATLVCEAIEPYDADSADATVGGFDWFNSLYQATVKGVGLTLVLRRFPERARSRSEILLLDQLRVLANQGVDLRLARPEAPPAPWDAEIFGAGGTPQRLIGRPDRGLLVLAQGQSDFPTRWKLARSEQIEEADEALRAWLAAHTRSIGASDALFSNQRMARIERLPFHEAVDAISLLDRLFGGPWAHARLRDSYIRRDWQFETLRRLLDVLAHAAAPGAIFEIATKLADDEKDRDKTPEGYQEEQFATLRSAYQPHFTLNFDIIGKGRGAAYHQFHDREFVIERPGGRRTTYLPGRGLDFLEWGKAYSKCWTKETTIAVFEEVSDPVGQGT